MDNEKSNIQLRDIKGSNVSLIRYDESHDIQTVEWLRDPEVRSGFGFTGDITLDSHRQWINESPNVVIWAITTLVENVHIGNILIHLDVEFTTAYFQMYIGKTYLRGKGFGREALELCLDCAFRDFALSAISLHVFPDNKRAIHLYEQAGFIRESVEEEVKRRDGSLCSQYKYVLSHENWLCRVQKSEGEG